MKTQLIIAIYLAMDLLWITINKKFYNESIKNVQNTDIKIKLIPAFLSYILLLLNIFFILIPYVTDVWVFSLSGFIIYGVYNMTNMATFENYPIQMAIVDTFWGAFSHFILGSLILGI